MAARLSDAIKEQNVDTGFEAHPAILQGNEAIARFVLGGNATFTLENTATGNRFTFKVRALEDRKGAVSHFVSLLNGSDNEADFAYLGQLYRDSFDFAHGQKSRIGKDTPSAKAFAWLAKRLLANAAIPEQVRVWHEGRCGCCGRKLTVPGSIASGFGPKCAQHV